MPNTDYWKRLQRHEHPRRRVLQAAALGGAGLAAGTLVACSGREESASPSSTTATREPKRGGIINRLTALDGVFNQGLDPHKTGGSETGLMNFWYQGLLRSHPVTYEVEGEIAQKWEQPSPTEYVFNLASNIKWHDKPPVNGRAYTARDAAFSLDRFRTNDPLFVNRSLLGAVDRIEAVNDTTLRVSTKVADVTTLLNLADLTCLMLAPEVIQRFDRLTTAEHVVGTGAFILREKDDTKATMVRNPDYWKAGMPYLDGANMAWIQEQQSQFAAFLAGQLDIVQVPGEQSKKFLAERGNQFFTGWSPGVNCWFISPNVKQKPYDDARVTRALRLMIDHQEGVKAWAEVYFGNGSSWILPHAMEPWDLSPDEYANILEWKQPKDEAAREAVALLSAAGFTRSNPLRFKLVNNNEPSTGQVTSQLVQGMWHRHSQGAVQLELELVDNAASRTRQATGQFEVSGPIGRGSYYDPDQYLTQNYHSKGSINWSKYEDARLDAMIDRERTIFDTAQRKAAVKEIVRYVIDNAPQGTLASRDILNATQLKVKDFLPEPGRWPGWQYERIWLDT